MKFTGDWSSGARNIIKAAPRRNTPVPTNQVVTGYPRLPTPTGSIQMSKTFKSHAPTTAVGAAKKKPIQSPPKPETKSIPGGIEDIEPPKKVSPAATQKIPPKVNPPKPSWVEKELPKSITEKSALKEKKKDENPWVEKEAKTQTTIEKSAPKPKTKEEEYPSLPSPPPSVRNPKPTSTKPKSNDEKKSIPTSKIKPTDDFPSLPSPKKSSTPQGGSNNPTSPRVIQLTSNPIGPMPSLPGIGGVGRGKAKPTTNNNINQWTKK